MPQWYGCTGPTTEATIAYVRQAAEEGADGAVVAAPAYICAPNAGHRALLPRRRRCLADPDRHLQQPAAGEDRPRGRGRAAPRRAPAHHRAEGEHRARRPGRPGLRREAGRLDHVLLLAEPRAGRADDEPRRPRHREHDRQHHPGGDGGDLDALGRGRRAGAALPGGVPALPADAAFRLLRDQPGAGEVADARGRPARRPAAASAVGARSGRARPGLDIVRALGLDRRYGYRIDAAVAAE